jgi:hypothetical protein
MMGELVAVALLAGLTWLWLDGLRAREVAVQAARRACAGDGVQLLDDTVMLASLRLARAGGRAVLRRVYHFEFSDTGDNRLSGAITLAGSSVDMLYLEPHRAGDIVPRHTDS